MPQVFPLIPVLVFLSGVRSALASTPAALAGGFAGPAPESFALSPCAIVHIGGHARVYLTGPSGEVEAVDAGTGKVLWHTPSVAFVLLAREDRLLGVLPAVARGKTGCGAAIIEGRTGRILSGIPWPGDKPIGCVGESINNSFHLEGYTAGGSDYLRWTKKWGPKPGGAYRPKCTPAPGSTGESHGAFLVDLPHGTLEEVAGEAPDPALGMIQGPGVDFRTERFPVDGLTVEAAKEVTGITVRLTLRRWRGSEALPEVRLGEPRSSSCGFVVSADRRHVLAVSQVPGNKRPILYHVEIRAAVTGEGIGEFDATRWPAVCQVCGSDLVAYSPWRVFAVRISTGREIWSRPVKDLSYRGPYPPMRRPSARPVPAARP